MKEKLRIERVERVVIENQLMTSLEDKSRVACLFTEEDLDTLIDALMWQFLTTRANEMRQDLQKLKHAAFPKPDSAYDGYKKNLRKN